MPQERYDASFAHLKSVIRDRDIENSELKITAAEHTHAAKQERDRSAENEAYYQTKLAQVRGGPGRATLTQPQPWPQPWPQFLTLRNPDPDP